MLKNTKCFINYEGYLFFKGVCKNFKGNIFDKLPKELIEMIMLKIPIPILTKYSSKIIVKEEKKIDDPSLEEYFDPKDLTEFDILGEI